MWASVFKCKPTRTGPVGAAVRYAAAGSRRPRQPEPQATSFDSTTPAASLASRNAVPRFAALAPAPTALPRSVTGVSSARALTDALVWWTGMMVTGAVLVGVLSAPSRLVAETVGRVVEIPLHGEIEHPSSVEPLPLKNFADPVTRITQLPNHLLTDDCRGQANARPRYRGSSSWR